jgi:[ribosomal protein S18]-alanine N-acetyltransferase
MISGTDFLVRPAVQTDQRGIANLIHFSPHVHRHLDWRNPLDWIGSPPYFVIENQGKIIAALGCPPDPPAVAWVRLFVSFGVIPVQESWMILWEKAQHELIDKGQFTAAAIVLQDWLKELLLSSGFLCHQSIVLLERDGGSAVELKLPADTSIRGMMPYDLPAVAKVDAAAFDHLWQNSLPALDVAYPQAILPTVAENHGKLIGYQISTRNPLGVHLARLAVVPSAQGRGVGFALVADLIHQTERRGMSHLTVNTQSDNGASLALYQRMGFHETGERYPVYQLDISAEKAI